jgi:hypothetical protein
VYFDHRPQQPFWRIAIADKGIGLGIQGYLTHFRLAAEGDYPQAGAVVVEENDQGTGCRSLMSS